MELFERNHRSQDEQSKTELFTPLKLFWLDAMSLQYFLICAHPSLARQAFPSDIPWSASSKGPEPKVESQPRPLNHSRLISGFPSEGLADNSPSSCRLGEKPPALPTAPGCNPDPQAVSNVSQTWIAILSSC